MSTTQDPPAQAGPTLTDVDAELAKTVSPAFLKFIQNAKTAAEASAPPPHSTSTWLQELSTLDVSSDDALFDFIAKTYVGDVEPIPLGSHKGVSYFLETGRDGIPQRGSISLTPLERMRGVSDYVKSYEYDVLPGGDLGGPRPDLRYGFGLGYLAHQLPAATGAQATTALEATGFFVVYNVVDRSLWITVDYKPFADAGTEFRVDPLPRTWGLLPEDDELQIGTMRISQPSWWTTNPLSVTTGDPFEIFPPCNWQMISKPAVSSEYLDWLPSNNAALGPAE